VCADWSADGKTLVTGTNRSFLHLWDVDSGLEIQRLDAGTSRLQVAVFSSGDVLASSGDDVIHLWDWTGGRKIRELTGHVNPVYGLAWSPNGKTLYSSSWDDTIRIWDATTGDIIHVLRGHASDVNCVACSPDGKWLVSCSDDRTVRVWSTDTGQPKHEIQGHTRWIASVSFLDEGRLLVSLGGDGTAIFWRTDTWSEVSRFRMSHVDTLSNIATHPTLPIVAARSRSEMEIDIWEIDFDLLRGAITPTFHYVNAKAVLLGESGVGKTSLGITIAEGKYRPPEGSTHGAQFWHFPAEGVAGLPENVKAELTLWDLAGQPEYRLTHQLFLDDLDAALLLFDCSDSSDPFRGVPYWAKVLKKQAPTRAVKLLVSARCDVSPVTASQREINYALQLYGLDGYYKTSAREAHGVDVLFSRLLNSIPWDQLPRTSTPLLFQIVREFLLEQKAAGITLISVELVRISIRERFMERAADDAELDTVVRLLQSRGLVYRLEPRPGVAIVLLKPELINQYGASIIQAARNHPLEIGAVSERDVLVSNLTFSGFVRLPPNDESLVLEATIELLIRTGLCFREMGYLVFPSQITVTRLSPAEVHPRTEVAYRFSGSIETIYASLVVRLSYTDYFRREDQWKYAVEFSRDGNRLGFSMRQIEEGTSDLEIYFSPGITEFDRVTFIRFLTDHLRAKGVDIQEQIKLYCPQCSREVTNHDAIEARVYDGKLDIPCQYCATPVLIPRGLEERYRRDPSLSEKQRQLAEIVETRTTAEVEQFRADQQLYTAPDPRVHILHLSDLHVSDEELAGLLRMQLETDLIQELGIRRLDYLVISGDIVNRSEEDEYRIAFSMVDGLVKRFGLDASRVVVVPGNHDLSWTISKAAYPFVYREDLPPKLAADRYVPAGDTGVLLRREEAYRDRFANFSAHFYKRIYSGQEFPTAYADQSLWIENSKDRILFLGLNSSWEIDHHFRDRASIHMPALAKALDRLQNGAYDGWLKIAVWHHPVAGKQMMNDEFLELLAVHGFSLCLHGHIHEAIELFHKYDEPRGVRIVGGGTFGAPASEQVRGIPLQYNLLSFDPPKREITVCTRKKERPAGAWSADARWGSKMDPKPCYTFAIARP
jgi:GTPase SAR1 family protein/predicted MPP superfamily phosphohydrolase/sugar lactone lactonase YvrE